MCTEEALARRGEKDERESRGMKGREWASSSTVWNGTQWEKGQESPAVVRLGKTRQHMSSLSGPSGQPANEAALTWSGWGCPVQLSSVALYRTHTQYMPYTSSRQQPQSVPYTVVKEKHVQEDRREGSGQYLPLDCLFSSLRASRREGSEPFTHVYTMSIGSSGQRLRGGDRGTLCECNCINN